MGDTAQIAEAEPFAAESADQPVQTLAEEQSAELTSYDWPQIAGGIVLAGGIYPAVLVAIYIAVGCFTMAGQTLAEIQQGGQWASLLLVIVVGASMSLGVACFLGLIGIIWSAIVTLVTMPLVYLFVRSLALRGSVVWFGAVWGGLVGLLAVFPIPMVLIANLSRTGNANLDSELILALAAGPGLATIVGQLGGAWGGRRAGQLHSTNSWAYRLASAGGWQATPPTTGEEDAAPSTNAEWPRFQFGIRHLLWITVWLSVMLSVIRLAGMPLEYLLPLLLGWLVYQSATLGAGWIIARRIVPWWTKPQTNSAGRQL